MFIKCLKQISFLDKEYENCSFGKNYKNDFHIQRLFGPRLHNEKSLPVCCLLATEIPHAKKSHMNTKQGTDEVFFL